VSNIRNEAHYLEASADWSFLNGCFGNDAIRVADVDGAVEINGHTLFFEWKTLRGYVSGGVGRMFDTWSARGDYVLVLWGPKGDPQFWQVWRRKRKESDKKPCTIHEVQDFVRRWARWARALGAGKDGG
jgi:hypothetical protein